MDSFRPSLHLQSQRLARSVRPMAAPVMTLLLRPARSPRITAYFSSVRNPAPAQTAAGRLPLH